MKLFNNGFKIGGSFAIGIGAAFLAPIVVPAIAGIIRPVAKAAIKGGMLAYEKVRVAGAETIENFEDLVAEAKAEIYEEQVHIPEE